MPPSDSANAEDDLLARLCVGDASAFDTVARLHAADLVRYAYRFTRSLDMAEDIVQDILCRVWDTRAHLASRLRGSLRDYLFGAVRLRTFEVQRSMRSLVHREGRYAQAERVAGGLAPDDPASDLEQRELVTAIRQALDALPGRRRQILLLRWQQLSTREIAEAMGISMKTVEAQITSAYAALRDRLGDWVR